MRKLVTRNRKFKKIHKHFYDREQLFRFISEFNKITLLEKLFSYLNIHYLVFVAKGMHIC